MRLSPDVQRTQHVVAAVVLQRVIPKVVRHFCERCSNQLPVCRVPRSMAPQQADHCDLINLTGLSD